MSVLQHLPSLVERSKKRLGRGPGSGKGKHTVGRGTKGQRARKSGEAPLWFEGGQLPLVKRLPMLRGKSRFVSLTPVAEVSLNDLEKMKSAEVTLETLKLEKVIDARFSRAKVVSNGTLKRSVTIKGVTATANAKKIIEQAGGTVS